MFGLGFWEFIIIVVAIIVFIKPDDLPRFLRNLGRMFGKFHVFYRNFQELTARVERELERQISISDTDGRLDDKRRENLETKRGTIKGEAAGEITSKYAGHELHYQQ